MMRRLRPYAWSFLDQGSSSATNLGLSVVAARTLGPAGLGATLVGFAAYLLFLGMQRAVISDPLVTSSVRASARSRAAATSAALACAIMFGAGSAGALFAAGSIIPGSVGRGTLVFAPWIAAALVQDLYRVVLFRDGRPAAAALTDGVWLAVSAAAAPVAWLTPGLWAPSLCWGLGAVAGAVAGALAVPLGPTTPGKAIGWLRHDAWPFGRWLAAEGAAYHGSAYVLAWVLVLIIGASSYGGLRATQSIFAPLSLLIPFVAMPGLPAVSRALGASLHAAKSLAVRLTVGLLMMTAAYVVVVASWPSLLAILFGADFRHFSYLVWPIGLAQIVSASTGGLLLLFKAQQRGPALVVLRLVGSLSLLALSVPFAHAWGALGAAWAGVAGAAVLLIATLFATTSRHHRVAAPATARVQ
jgi:O-antigen/teichoic acid export membrane protein